MQIRTMELFFFIESRGVESDRILAMLLGFVLVKRSERGSYDFNIKWLSRNSRRDTYLFATFWSRRRMNYL